jgi:hypothetical protein
MVRQNTSASGEEIDGVSFNQNALRGETPEIRGSYVYYDSRITPADPRNKYNGRGPRITSPIGQTVSSHFVPRSSAFVPAHRQTAFPNASNTMAGKVMYSPAETPKYRSMTIEDRLAERPGSVFTGKANIYR